MSRVCTVCRHVDRAVLDRQLIEGKLTLRDIATRSGCSRSAILRHRTEHLPKALGQAAERKGLNRAEQLQDRLDTYIADLVRLRRKAERKGKYSVAISAVRELTRLAGLEAGMLGLLRAPSGSQTLVQISAAPGPVDHAEALREARLLIQDAEDEARDALALVSPGVQVQTQAGGQP